MRGAKLTDEQRDLLLSTYRDGGYAAAKPLAIEFRVAPRYVARLARDHGIKNNYARGKVSIVKQQRYTDKRWKWAVERGVVIA